jgi:alkylhydroperoxidase/carboxymuconolactone decarboxylase family protein YurZ
MDDQRRAAKGKRLRQLVMGADYVRDIDDAAGSFTAPFQDLINRYLWGEIWQRPGLSRRDRSVVTLAVLIALGLQDELGRHVAAAKRNGVNEEEIQEILLQASAYVGVPASNRAFATVRSALRAERR